MDIRTYKNKRGEVWTGYYYVKRDVNGKRKCIPLGSDYDAALKKWAEMECKPVVLDNSLSAVYAKYLKWALQREISGLAEITITEYQNNWKKLEPVFGQISIDKIKPEWLLRYFDDRSSKYRGKKEIKFIGTLFNWAKARGYATTANPVTGLTRQMKAPSRRTIYVTDSDFALVRKHAIQPLQDAMDIALLTGQRPADVFKMRWSDIQDGVLHIKQNKTDAVVRIAVTGMLKNVLDEIRSRKVISITIVKKMTNITFRRAFDDARNKAEAEAKEKGIEFQRFQFKDLRAKAATDSATQNDAQKLLGHKNQATTVIYRRDKGEVVEPLMSKSLLDMKRISGEK